MQTKELDPGEDVRVENNKVQVSGQVAVMNINGLLTKVMFDHNPKNEFFVEESFPLKWMYPHLTPYGIIMKINRQPLSMLSEDVMRRDHEFWKQYSKRTTGDILDYDTPVKDVVAWIEKTYLRYNLEGFTGDRKFVHDMDAQKAFSKLRSSIGGIYQWRLSTQCPPEYRPKSPAELQRVLKEADFAFKQAFAFCPYSPEAVFRYANLLIQFGRMDDALLVAETCQKMDPYNGQVKNLVDNLENYKKSQAAQQGSLDQAKHNLQSMEDEVRAHPTNYQTAFNLASAYVSMGNTDRANQILDGILNDPHAEANAVLAVAQAYNQMQNFPKLEVTLEKLVKIMPSSPEAWYDLASFKSGVGKATEALPALRQAIELSAKRLKADPKARDLLAQARSDEHFNPLRQSPEFKKLVSP
jgi:tetratricopeptide (TPR) repeat protein